MTKYLGLAGAMRHMSRCLPVILSGAVVVAGPGAAFAKRPDHSAPLHRYQENAGRPDFSRTATTKSKKKHAPTSSARGNEHKADEGQAKPDAKSPAKGIHKASPRRHRQIEPDDDPIIMKRAGAARRSPSKATEQQHLAERGPAPAGHPRARSGHAEIAAKEQPAREASGPSHRGQSHPPAEPSRETVAISQPLNTGDFLRAAHGEPEVPERATERTTERFSRSSAPAQLATGVSHPPSGNITVSAPQPAAPSYIDERQVAEAQRVAIGDALRPQEIGAEARKAPEPAAWPTARASSMSSSLPASAPTESNYGPEAHAPVWMPAATQAANQPASSSVPTHSSYIAARTVEGEEATSRAPEDAVRSTALGQLSREEITSAAVAPSLPGLYSRDGHIIVPAPLKGSHEVLVHQNEMADAAGLTRIRNDRELDQLRREHRLVDFEETDGLRINPELPERRRCARPWTVAFATQMARAYYAEFHEPFTISSAVRTMAFQARLQRVNGNAAALHGEAASPHLTGQAFDIGKSGLTIAQIAWLRTYLAPLIEGGKIDVEEEFQQACFHISVYPGGSTTHRRTQLAEVQ